MGSHNLLSLANNPIAFGDVIDWQHSYDVNDAVMYIPSQSVVDSYEAFGSIYIGNLNATTPRIDYIPDRGVGNLPHTRDTGPWAASYLGAGATPLPGPLLGTDLSRHKGRKYLDSDQLLGASGGAYPIAIASMLSPVLDPRGPYDPMSGGNGPLGADGSATYFNAPHGYPVPYACVVLTRIQVFSFLFRNIGTGVLETLYVGSAFMDTYRGVTGGGPTWAAAFSDYTKYGVQCFGPNDVTGVYPGFQVGVHSRNYPTANSSGVLISGRNENVLGIVQVGVGTNQSYMDLTTISDEGAIVSERSYFTLGSIPNSLPFPFEEFFSGYVHRSQTSALGIKLGTLSEVEIAAIKQWGTRYL